MTDKTQYLLELLKRNVKAYIANPKTKAVMVTGSVAEGLCDEYSDCDVCLYYHELPSEAELQFARQQNQGAELIEILGNPQDGAFGESFLMNGIEFQFAHATIAQWEEEMSTVLEKFDVPSPLMKMLNGTAIGIPLYGEALIRQCKAKVANYPGRLAQTMVEKYLEFFAVWGMEEKLARRDTTLWYYQIMVKAAQNLLGVLSGLNYLYYSTSQFKRMSRFIEQMEIAPENLAARLEGLFHYEPHIAVHQLEELVMETVELVEIHMPQVNTSSAKRKLGWRQQPWKLSEADR
jgi:Nucleotidyltransferase domain